MMVNPTVDLIADQLPADREYLGQNFAAVEFVPYVTKDGTPIRLIRWRSQCATCGADYETTWSERAATFKPRRRCDEHLLPAGQPRTKMPPVTTKAERVQRVRDLFEADPGLEAYFGGWLPDWVIENRRGGH